LDGDLIMAKFFLEIDLGNDAMKTPEDIGGALQRVGRMVEQTHDPKFGEWKNNIRDINGNKVGFYEVR